MLSDGRVCVNRIVPRRLTERDVLRLTTHVTSEAEWTALAAAQGAENVSSLSHLVSERRSFCDDSFAGVLGSDYYRERLRDWVRRTLPRQAFDLEPAV